MSNASLGYSSQISTRDQSRNFFGQFGAFYLFGESLPAPVFSEIHNLGPSYFHNFIHSAEDGFGSRFIIYFFIFFSSPFFSKNEVTSFTFVPLSKTLFDGKLASKIIACYNARACVKPQCWDNTPVGNLQYFLDKKNGQIKPGTIPVIRSSLKTVIRVVGGVKSIFPLFAQLGKALEESLCFIIALAS